MKHEVKRMVAEIFEVARRDIGFVSPATLEAVEKNLVLRLTNREGRSYGGRKDRRPYMSIAMKSVGWAYTDPGAVAERLRLWGERLNKNAARGLRDPKATKWTNAFKRVNLVPGDGVWLEYPAIANDPEIGNLYGDADDKLKPLAALLCHELAHVLDYNAGELFIDGRRYGPNGTNHGEKWRAIYRALRNGYVNNGAYKRAPVIAIATPTKPTRRFALLGLPLFDFAAA
jgi:hypothetical protein